MMTPVSSATAGATLDRSHPASSSFDIAEFELLRRFVEHLVAKEAPGESGRGHSSADAVDWKIVAASVADSRSLEHAIGRVVVIADQLARGIVEDSQVGDPRIPPTDEDPFFAFTLADVVADFGDDRYRTRVARRVARIIGSGGQ